MLAGASAIVRRTLAQTRGRDLSFAALFALVSYASAAGYRGEYPTLADRLGFARTLGANTALRLFYGRPFDLLSVGGFAAWRAGGFLAIAAGAWGVIAAVRALRGEEDSGRTELVLSAPLGRGLVFAATLAAAGAAGLMLAAGLLAALLAAGLALAGSFWLTLSTLAPAGVFWALGALSSQLAPTRRRALELAAPVLLLALLARTVADTSSQRWLDWLTPLGWSEQVRAFAGVRPWVLALPVALTLAVLALAARLAQTRDTGRGLLASADNVAPRRLLLGSPTRLALREELGTLAAWVLGTGLFAGVIGLISTSVTSAGISPQIERELRKLGGLATLGPAAYVGLCLLFFVLAISLFACGQLASARHEEAEGRLETLLAQPLGRRSWLCGRLALAVGGILALSLVIALLAAAGAALGGAGIGVLRMLEAGANCLAVPLLFLGVGSVAWSLLPRQGTAIAYGLVVLAFVWQLLGALLGAPQALRELSPFEHLALVPAQPIDLPATGVMIALGALATGVALWTFGRRDLASA